MHVFDLESKSRVTLSSLNQSNLTTHVFNLESKDRVPLSKYRLNLIFPVFDLDLKSRVALSLRE